MLYMFIVVKKKIREYILILMKFKEVLCSLILWKNKKIKKFNFIRRYETYF